MSVRLFAVLLMALAPAAARAEPLIIDMSPKKPKPGPPPVPDLQILMSDTETSHNLSAGVAADLKAQGYTLGPEVDFEKLKEGRTAKALLHFDITRIDASCFVTAKAAEFKTQDKYFFRWQTKDGDDLKPCTDLLKAAIGELVKVRLPSHAPPPGLDAGTPAGEDAGPLLAKLVLAPQYVSGDEPPDAGAVQPVKKKGCGCQGPDGALPASVAILLLLPALARPRRRA